MKQFCKFSGVLLQSSNHFHNLLTNKEFYSLSSHQIFDYGTSRILDFATRKSIESFTSEEKHLLVLSLLHSHRNFLVSFPIAPGRISQGIIFQIWDSLIKSSISIAAMNTYWERALAAGNSPYYHVTEELIKSDSFEHSLKEWTTNILPQTIYHLKNQGNKREISDIWSEVELERQLTRELLEERLNNRKYNKYTIEMGRFVWNKIKQVEYKDAQNFLTIPFLNMCEGVLSTNVPSNVKYPISSIREIIDFIDRFLNPHSNHNQKSETEWKNPIERNYILFTLSYLHSVIQYFHDLDSLFTNIDTTHAQISRTKEKLMSKEFNSPIEFTIHRTVTQLEVIEIDDTKPVAQTEGMAKILARIKKHNIKVNESEHPVQPVPGPDMGEVQENSAGPIDSSVFE